MTQSARPANDGRRTNFLLEDNAPAGDGGDQLALTEGIRMDRESNVVIAAARGYVAVDPVRRFDGPGTFRLGRQRDVDGLAGGRHVHVLVPLIRFHGVPALLEQ